MCTHCQCQQPDSISFWWMNDNHTFVRLKGKNLNQIIAHAKRCYKKDPYGMLCPATLLKDGRDVYRLGESVHGMEKESVRRWKQEILDDNHAKNLLDEGKIDQD